MAVKKIGILGLIIVSLAFAQTFDPETGELHQQSDSLIFDPETGLLLQDRIKLKVLQKTEGQISEEEILRLIQEEIREAGILSPPAREKIVVQTIPALRQLSRDEIIAMAKEQAKMDHSDRIWLFGGGLVGLGGALVGGIVGGNIADFPGFLIGAIAGGVATSHLLAGKGESSVFPSKLYNAQSHERELYSQTYKRETRKLRSKSVMAGEAIIFTSGVLLVLFLVASSS